MNRRSQPQPAHNDPLPSETLSDRTLLSLRRLIVTDLAQRRANYDQMVASLDHALRDSHASAGEDAADIGSRAFENDQARHLTASRREHIDQLEQALQRIDEGSYGQCEDCRAAIPTARLRAYPTATLCVACKVSAPHR